jgi:hypothetical protein
MTKLPGEDSAFANTEPQPLPSARPAAAPLESLGLSLAPVEESLYEVLAEIRKNNRVCPLPTRWLEFHRLLEGMAGGAPLPPAPLVGSAWAATLPAAKRNCLREQVEWADARKGLNAAHEFLSGLSDADWYCD